MNPDLARVNFREWPQRLGLVSLRVDERAVWKRCIIAFLGDSKARGRVVCRANAREFWREQREKGAGVNLEAFAAALDWFCGCGVRRGKSGNAKVESGNGNGMADGKGRTAEGVIGSGGSGTERGGPPTRPRSRIAGNSGHEHDSGAAGSTFHPTRRPMVEEKQATASGRTGVKHDPAGMADWERGLLRGMRIGHYRERTWETYRHWGRRFVKFVEGRGKRAGEADEGDCRGRISGRCRIFWGTRTWRRRKFTRM